MYRLTCGSIWGLYRDCNTQKRLKPFYSTTRQTCRVGDRASMRNTALNLKAAPKGPAPLPMVVAFQAAYPLCGQKPADASDDPVSRFRDLRR